MEGEGKFWLIFWSLMVIVMSIAIFFCFFYYHKKNLVILDCISETKNELECKCALRYCDEGELLLIDRK